MLSSKVFLILLNFSIQGIVYFFLLAVVYVVMILCFNVLYSELILQCYHKSFLKLITTKWSNSSMTRLFFIEYRDMRQFLRILLYHKTLQYTNNLSKFAQYMIVDIFWLYKKEKKKKDLCSIFYNDKGKLKYVKNRWLEMKKNTKKEKWSKSTPFAHI